MLHSGPSCHPEETKVRQAVLRLMLKQPAEGASASASARQGRDYRKKLLKQEPEEIDVKTASDGICARCSRLQENVRNAKCIVARLPVKLTAKTTKNILRSTCRRDPNWTRLVEHCTLMAAENNEDSKI
jgi:hypothetical protein